jgi:hypothetical protein
VTRRRLLAAALLAAGAGACKRKRTTPEDRVRLLLAELETAVEEKDLDPIEAAISERYEGEHDTDRKAVIGTMQVMFLRHPAIYLVVRIQEIELPAPGQARAQLLVGMASVPVQSAEELPRVNADLHRFTLELAEEEPERYRIVGARWEPARLEAFF